MSKRFRDYRHFMRRTAVVVSGCALAAVLLAATPTANLPELDEVEVIAEVSWPLEDYLEFPRYDSVVISPGGTHLALGWGEDSFQRRLSIIGFPSMKPINSGLLQIHFGVTDLRWLDEQRLLLQPDWPLLGLRRVRKPVGTLLVTDIGGRTLHELNPIKLGTVDAFDIQRRRERMAAGDSENSLGPNVYGPVRAVTAHAGKTDQLLLQTLWVGRLPKTDGYGVFQLDLKSGKQSRVATLPLRGGHVITGAEHRPVLVAGRNQLDEQVVYYLPEDARAEGTDWKLLVNSGSGERGLRPFAWTGTGEDFYALDGRETPTRAVVVWNARDNTQRMLYRHPDADMDEVWQDPGGKPWMFSGVSHFPVYWYPDPAHPLAQLHHTLAQQLAPEHVDIMNATDDLSTAVVRVTSGARPTMFLLVDVKTAKSITGMHTFPKLRGRRLSSVEAIEFRARDGVAIRGYLTTPLDSTGKPRDRLPLLIISHGGPRGEVADSRYDVERQLFASRGYAVLEVNARGSIGRGAAFAQAGEGKWGREVQDDFADAVRWAIKDGVAAAGRTCFYGTGYGAYSAMIAAAREPDLFQCVIGVAGIYDLPQMVQTMESSSTTEGKSVMDYFLVARHLSGENVRMALEESETGRRRPTELQRQTRDDADDAVYAFFREARDSALSPLPPDDADLISLYLLLQRAFGSDMEELEARSPISHAPSIKARVLLLHQHLDKQVPWEQAQAMNSALRSAGNRAQIDTIGLADEGYFTLATRTAVYGRMLRFLDQQIGQ